MRLDEKARENLEAVERLLETNEGMSEPLKNAAASRAYYAAYEAVVDRALRVGRRFPTTGYFKHDELPDEAFRSGILSDSLREQLIWLRDLHVKADYYEDQIDYDEASLASDYAKQSSRRRSEICRDPR